jgi:hypothetical protein
MQDFLLSLRRKVKDGKSEFKRSEKEACEKMRIYSSASKGKDSLEIQRVKALIGKEHIYESGERLVSDLLLLDNIHILAEYMYEQKLLLDKIELELEESGIRKLIKNTDAINELVERIRQLKEQTANRSTKDKSSQKELKRKLDYVS